MSASPGNMGGHGATIIDENMENFLRSLRDKTTSAMNQPYTPYPSVNRFANRPAAQTQAARQLNQGIGGWKPYADNAQNLTWGSIESFPQHSQQFMNPYENRVVDRMAELSNRNFEDHILPALEAKFVRLGQHGSSQHQKFAREAARDAQTELSRLQGQFLHEGYDQSARLFEEDRLRKLRAAEMMAKLSQSYQSQNAQDFNNLLRLADQERLEDQQLKDFEYQQFLEKRQYPRETVNFGTGVAHGMPYSTTTTHHSNFSPRTSPRRQDHINMLLNFLANNPWTNRTTGS